MGNCSGGPSGDAWSAAHGICVASSAATSCDSVGQTTCWFCFLLDSSGKGEWFSGKFVPDQGLKIHEPAALAQLGIGPGDILAYVNGVLLVDEDTVLSVLAPFTPDAPAVVYSAAHLHGRIHLSLSH